MHTKRLERAMSLMQAHQVDALALLPGPNLYYLTGLTFHLMERPIVGLFSATGESSMIVPKLEHAKLEAAAPELSSFAYGEDEPSRRKAFENAAKDMGLEEMRVGVETTRMRFLELTLLKEAAPDAQFLSGENVLSTLRTIKTEDELKAMRAAVEIAQQALQAALPHIQAGMSEREVESELTMQLLRSGSESDLPFRPIVASGPNAALPHAAPGDRKLQAGDLLILDWGARSDGYISDITRTFAVGVIDPELAQIHEIVAQANVAGRSAVRPGAAGAEVDLAARAVIESAGYGEAFIHRTGHGIGLEGHEAPYIRDDSQEPLAIGMTFTVEPGIYLPERGGVRVEDNVLVTKDGCECLTSLPRDLVNIA